MTPIDPTKRQPKGDNNRRLSMRLDPDQFATEAGVTTEQLREYERTSPNHQFDPTVAERVGEALDRLEAKLPNLQTTRREPAPGFSQAQVGEGGRERPIPGDAPEGTRYTTGDEP